MGVDVASKKRGYHVAVIANDSNMVAKLLHAFEPEDLARQLEAANVLPAVIAIDCPPKAVRHGHKARLAERQLHALGARVQWTRHVSGTPLEWMLNGERLWEYFKKRYPNATLIETFPTASLPRLERSPVLLPISVLAGHGSRRDWKDFVDAVICADVAVRYAHGDADRVGVDLFTGEVDEFGPIYY